MNWKLSSGILGSAISMILIAGLPGVTAYGQNATGIEAITKATGTPLTNNTGSQSNQSSQPAQPLGNLLVEHAGVLLQVCKPTLTILRYRINV